MAPYNVDGWAHSFNGKSLGDAQWALQNTLHKVREARLIENVWVGAHVVGILLVFIVLRTWNYLGILGNQLSPSSGILFEQENCNDPNTQQFSIWTLLLIVMFPQLTGRLNLPTWAPSKIFGLSSFKEGKIDVRIMKQSYSNCFKMPRIRLPLNKKVDGNNPKKSNVSNFLNLTAELCVERARVVLTWR